MVIQMVIKKLNSLKIKNRKGAAMIVAIIIMGILIVFTFSLMLVAYTLYSSQTKNIASMKCSESANTLSIALKDELNDENAALRSHLYQYVRYNICQETWPNYTGNNEAEAFRYFSLKYNANDSTHGGYSSVEGFPGSIKVCMYWMLPDESQYYMENSGITKKFSEVSDLNHNGVRLFVEVTSESANQSYTVKQKYVLEKSTYSNKEAGVQGVLFGSSVMGDKSINPYGKVQQDIFFNEKWSWTPVYGD